MILRHLFGILVVLTLLGAVLWELDHLIYWSVMLSDDPLDYLREHAYTYISYVFGENPFGWRAE